MENTKPTIDINKLKTVKIDEAQLLIYLFGTTRHNILLLLAYGFKYDYTHNCFESNIIINNRNHNITINKSTDKELKYFYISISNKDSLKNSSYLSLYDKKINNISQVSFEGFIYWIKNIYDTNVIEKDTFKLFVEKDKLDNSHLLSTIESKELNEETNKDLLYVVSIVSDEAKDKYGNVYKTFKYLPVYDTLDEAKEACNKKGGGEIMGITNPS